MNFTDFYSLYPRKVGRRAAEKAWDKEIRSGTSPEEIISGLMRNLKYLESRPMEFRPHPSTWLNQGRWEDEPQVIDNSQKRRSIVDAARDLISDSGNANWFRGVQH